MVFDSKIHHRKSYRLKGFDYTKEGAYFITICTHNSQHFFGEVVEGEMQLNEVGKIANEYLSQIPNHFSKVEIGEYIVMPNHVHCVLILHPKSAGTRHVASVLDSESKMNAFGKPIPGSVSVIIQQFKSSVKRWCNKNKFEDFKWQSRFYDVIIRDDNAYRRIANYIIENPKKWKM